MGVSFSQCLRLKKYMRVREPFETHPGMNPDSERFAAVAFEIDADSDENSESLFG